MITHIIDYIDFLHFNYNFYISIHDFNGYLNNFMDKLAQYNIHINHYCLFVKQNPDVWDKCISRQTKVKEKCKSGPFYGCCYAGVGEFVYPVKNEDIILGFVSVSGYMGDISKIKHFSDKYKINYLLLKEKANNYLSKNIPDKKFIDTIILPLVYMLELLYMNSPKLNTAFTENKVYGRILTYIFFNYKNKITISQIADICNCSESYISHLFKKKSGKSVINYLNEYRVNKSVHLLSETQISITDIASMCGFIDSNYFSYIFKKEKGISPKKYRQLHKINA